MPSHPQRPLVALAVTLGLAFSATGCDTGALEGTEVGPRGGIVRSDDGRVTLEVPGGAMVDTMTLSIVPADDAPEGAIGPTYALEPFGVTFATPAVVSYDISDCEMHDVGGVRLVTERDRGWDTLGDRSLDTERGELSASLLFTAAVGAVE